MSKINIIVAASNNNVIGKCNDIPWKLPTDLKYFKKITENSTVIMGRKCWESIPEKFRPLPNRINVIATRDSNFKANGAITIKDLDNVLNSLKNNDKDNNVFIIGGSEIYKQSFSFADKLYLTRVLADIDGDVYFEGFNESEWVMVNRGDIIEENGLRFVFEYYEKKY